MYIWRSWQLEKRIKRNTTTKLKLYHDDIQLFILHCNNILFHSVLENERLIVKGKMAVNMNWQLKTTLWTVCEVHIATDQRDQGVDVSWTKNCFVISLPNKLVFKLIFSGEDQYP